MAAAVDSAEGSRKRRKRQRLNEEGGVGEQDGRHKVKWANLALQKKAFGEAWLAFLRMDLPEVCLY